MQGAKLRFIHNELGYSPAVGRRRGRLAALIGRAPALRLFATCELLSAEEARSPGWWTRWCRARSCWVRAESLAASIGRAGREAVIGDQARCWARPDLTAHERGVRRAVGSANATMPA